MDQAVEQTVRFSKVWLRCAEKNNYSETAMEMDREIAEYIGGIVK